MSYADSTQWAMLVLGSCRKTKTSKMETVNRDSYPESPLQLLSPPKPGGNKLPGLNLIKLETEDEKRS